MSINAKYIDDLHISRGHCSIHFIGQGWRSIFSNAAAPTLYGEKCSLGAKQHLAWDNRQPHLETKASAFVNMSWALEFMILITYYVNLNAICLLLCQYSGLWFQILTLVPSFKNRNGYLRQHRRQILIG